MAARRPTPLQPTAAQWRALASPVRQELADALEGAGPCPVARLAQLLGRPADALYHHLRVLQRAGLVRVAGRRQVGRHAFAEYELVRRPLLAARGPRPQEAERVAGAAQRLAWRDFRRALRAGAGETRGARRTRLGLRLRAWLAADELARANALLDELLALLRAGRPGPGRTPLALGLLLAPLPEGRRPRAPRKRTRSGASR